jgi:Host cell surface-exposed lipoprotein
MTNPGAAGIHPDQHGDAYSQPTPALPPAGPGGPQSGRSDQPYIPPPGGTFPPQPPEKRKPWPRRHPVWTAIIALFLVGFIGSVVGGGNKGGSGTAASAASPSVAQPSMPPISSEQAAANSAASKAPAAPPASEATTPKPAPAKPKLTTAQENAIGSASDYLSTQGFSRLGLIKQLSSSYGDGYTKADATFAVDYLHPNWNEQAVRSARAYLATQHFSRAGLIQQLSSPYGDEYTVAQATYAADKVGL